MDQSKESVKSKIRFNTAASRSLANTERSSEASTEYLRITGGIRGTILAIRVARKRISIVRIVRVLIVTKAHRTYILRVR
ncbi:36162_t:CDS:2 [Gigaspora margarita]|uniref:36162_t:CDS:1 n=1 Tax=Gigaspora margarita TaxID=4874 RepID=A0ABN7UCL8_GIGMA|nr:36162_t:CDS:2 [Gigaspora margarita]